MTVTNDNKSKLLHFKYYRLLQWLNFLIRLPYHVIVHRPNPDGLDYNGWDIRGFIICNCGYAEDLGMSYAMHCEVCYNYIVGRK